jgi:hypothetical protein
MSEIDFTARAMALRALAQTPLSFAELSQAQLPTSVIRIDSYGYSVPGVGAAVYVADGLSDAALLAAHPAAVFEGAEGRLFRLVPDADGFITPEQLGCPTYSPGTNQQPYIQAAISYAEEFGYGVLFPQNEYELWTPLHVPDQDANTIPGATDFATANFTGIPIIVRKRIEMRAAPAGTTLWRRCNDGSDPSVFANTQTINDAYGYGYWRGGLICMVGKRPPFEDLGTLASLVFHGDWSLKGGIPRSATPGIAPFVGGKYRLRADGSGWDLTDKAIFPTGNSWVGNIEVYGNLEIDGFRGESLWRGGVRGGSIIVRGKLTCSNSDASAIDANMIRPDDNFDIDHLVVREVYQPVERTAGYEARIGKLEIFDCNLGGNIGGGNMTDPNATMTEVDDPRTEGDDLIVATGALDIGHVHVERIASGAFSLGRNVRCGRATAIDCGFMIGQSNISGWNISVDQMEVTADRASIGDALTILAASSNAAGSMQAKACRVKHLVVNRTSFAIANGKRVTNPVHYSGSLGADMMVERINGYSANQPFPRLIGSVPDWHVGVGELEDLQVVNYGAISQNIEASPTLAYAAPMMMLTTTTAGGHFTCTLPWMAGKLPVGSALWLNNESSGTAGVISIATTNTNLRRRLIMAWRRWVKFRLAGDGFWYLVDSPMGELSGSLTTNLQKAGAAISAGDVSDDATLAISGARAGMRVRVTPTSVISGDAELIGRVSANDTVAVRAQNMNQAAPLTIGTVTYRIALEWPN